MPIFKVRRDIHYYDVLEVSAPSYEDVPDAVNNGNYRHLTEETFNYTDDSDNWEIEEIRDRPVVTPRRHRVAILADAAADAALDTPPDIPRAVPMSPDEFARLEQAVRDAGMRARVTAVPIPTPIDDSVEDVQFEEE